MLLAAVGVVTTSVSLIHPVSVWLPGAGLVTALFALFAPAILRAEKVHQELREFADNLPGERPSHLTLVTGSSMRSDRTGPAVSVASRDAGTDRPDTSTTRPPESPIA